MMPKKKYKNAQYFKRANEEGTRQRLLPLILVFFTFRFLSAGGFVGCFENAPQAMKTPSKAMGIFVLVP